MIRSRATSVMKTLTNAPSNVHILRRCFAIASTVKVASDTSAMKFPAPSHVSISSEAADLARQLTEFYSSPDSVISIPENTRELLQAEVEKKVKSIPDSSLPDDYASLKLKVPSEIRLGDNPLFEAYNKSRTGPKLD